MTIIREDKFVEFRKVASEHARKLESLRYRAIRKFAFRGGIFFLFAGAAVSRLYEASSFFPEYPLEVAALAWLAVGIAALWTGSSVMSYRRRTRSDPLYSIGSLTASLAAVFFIGVIALLRLYEALPFYSSYQVAIEALVHAAFFCAVLWAAVNTVLYFISPQVFVKPYSLKEDAFSMLISFFGDFKFENLTDVEDMTTRGISPKQFHGCPHIPPYHIYRAEDYIHGVCNGAKVELSEAEMIVQSEGRQVSIFRGIILVIDIDEIKIKLRGKFGGRGTVIADAKKHSLSIQQHYADYERFALPEEFEERFEAYTTNQKAADKIFTARLLGKLDRLQASIVGAAEQVTHRDEQLHWLRAQTSRRLLYWFEKGFLVLLLVLRGFWALLFERVNYTDLFRKGVDVRGIWTRDRDYESINYEHIFDDDKFADTIAQSVLALNHCVECSFFDDKLVVTIPHPHDLFEPNSLFEPAINAHDIRLVFEIMTTVQEIAGMVAGAKDAMNKSAAPYA